MTQLEKQFRRLERTFEKVLDDRERELQDYADDAWNFFHACWHLKDWIQHDDESVPKAVGRRVEQDVESFWKMMLIGDLVNRTRRVRVNKNETDEEVSQRKLRITTPSPKSRWVNGLQQTDEGDSGHTVLVVVDGMSLEYPVRDLAKDAMRIWHTLFKLYGLNDLL